VRYGIASGWKWESWSMYAAFAREAGPGSPSRAELSVCRRRLRSFHYCLFGPALGCLRLMFFCALHRPVSFVFSVIWSVFSPSSADLERVFVRSGRARNPACRTADARRCRRSDRGAHRSASGGPRPMIAQGSTTLRAGRLPRRKRFRCRRIPAALLLTHFLACGYSAQEPATDARRRLRIQICLSLGPAFPWSIHTRTRSREHFPSLREHRLPFQPFAVLQHSPD